MGKRKGIRERIERGACRIENVKRHTERWSVSLC